LRVEKLDYAFDPQKNAWLIRERGISFEQVIALIESSKLIQVLEHPNTEKYPNQLLYELTSTGMRTSCRWSGQTGSCFSKRFIRAARRPGGAGTESPYEKAPIS